MLSRTLVLVCIILSLCLQVTGKVKCSKGKPNFLIIMTDDQGHDDVGFYNWKNILQTPNMDSFAASSVQFENFYTDSLCAPTRAGLLTGRHHMKTGVWGVHGAMDNINLDETLIGQAMKDAGYATAYYGKWHSGTTPGYNPWNRGFDLVYLTKLYVFYNNVVKMNGQDIYTQGWVEDWIADRIVDYLYERSQDGVPFFIVWTPMAIHRGRVNDYDWYEDFVAPPQYYDRYSGQVSRDLTHVFAALTHLDDVLGKVFQKLDEYGLSDNTVTMLFSDNGPHLYNTDHVSGYNREIRVPSFMANEKGFIEENGIRNFLFVKGPGFPAGRQVYENVGIIDIYPTVLDIAGVGIPEYNKPLDGLSFGPLLCKGGSWSHGGRTMYFHEVLKNTLGTNEIPALGSNRRVDKGQQLLQYYGGGQYGSGMEWFTGLKNGNYKFLRNSLYDVAASNHQEYNREYNSDLEGAYKQRLNDWWWSILSELGSFEKPIYLIGSEYFSPVRAIGTIERTPYHISVSDHAASGFKYSGDYLICSVQVVSAGTYNVQVQFGWTGYKGAYVTIAVGKYNDIMSGNAPAVGRKIDNNGPLGFGSITLPKTKGNRDEMIIRLDSRDWEDGSEVFWWIDAVEFYKQ
eukprot:TRINITY_DN7426_c0_g1_i16.p2 TRINITY_DN7426_c0_g1~~TRINITY_DN7426_c0_g1_i16.p2  ORF type:complete len:625 (-),score=57.35 TRINITY_DN7426_c0_g1_i16:2078-3952(-)